MHQSSVVSKFDKLIPVKIWNRSEHYSHLSVYATISSCLGIAYSNVPCMVHVEISIASFFELPEPILMILGAKWPHSGVLLEKRKNNLIFENHGPLFCKNDEKWTNLLTKTMKGSDFHPKIIREYDKIWNITFGKSFIFYQSRFVPIFSLTAPISRWHAPNLYISFENPLVDLLTCGAGRQRKAEGGAPQHSDRLWYHLSPSSVIRF